MPGSLPDNAYRARSIKRLTGRPQAGPRGRGRVQEGCNGTASRRSREQDEGNAIVSSIPARPARSSPPDDIRGSPSMIERTRIRTARAPERPRDEWSMRLVEYALAAVALGAVALLNLR